MNLEELKDVLKRKIKKNTKLIAQDKYTYNECRFFLGKVEAFLECSKWVNELK